MTASLLMAALAMAPASAVDTDAPDVNGTITVNAWAPNIAKMHLNDSLANPVLNSQIDVDQGAGTTIYTLNIVGWYNLSASDVDVVDVWMWKDDGTTSPEPDLSAAVDVGTNAYNLGVHFQANRGAPWTFAINSPLTAGDEEWQVLPSSSFNEYVNALVYYYEINIDFIAYQQVRAANANAGAWTDPTGPYGGALSKSQADATFPYAPLNDLDSWNVKAVVTDTDFAPAAVSMESWDEFGFYVYTSFVLGSQPGGGNIAGAGAPMTTITLTPSAADWTFSANAPYDLSVNISTLYGVLVPANSIPVAAVSISGGELAANPFALGVEQYLLGDSAAGTAEGPRETNRGTTTTTGAGNGAGGGNTVTWTCNIPAVLEDTYVGAITYHLDPDYS